MINLDDVFVVAEIAANHHVSPRTVERRIQQDAFPALKATPDQIASLFTMGRIKGIPPSGVWIVRKQDLHGLILRRKAGRRPRGVKHE